MQHIDINAALEALNQSAHLEYGTDFMLAINTSDEQLTVRRMARLAGIEMKRPFATPTRPPPGHSETGARQHWLLNQEFVACSGPDDPTLNGIKGNPSYELTVRIYQELQSQNDLETKEMSFGYFLDNNHSESNWFLVALRAAQPYLCDTPEVHVNRPTLPEKRRELWKLANEASEDLAKEGVKRAVEPVCIALGAMVPFLSAAPPAFVFCLSFVLVHFAKKGFCKANIQREIITTLRGNQQ